MTRIRAHSADDISEIVRGASRLRIVGLDSGATWRRPIAFDQELEIVSNGIVEHDVEDQVVVVSAGASIQELQEALLKNGQCLPWGLNRLCTEGQSPEGRRTVGGQLSLNLPHAFEAECGSWRDWVLGLTVVRADGTIAKCGSKAVKSVAGYDVQKLLIGARGTLGIIVQVILRTYPVRALPRPDYVEVRPWTEKGRIQRVLSTDFETAKSLNQDRLIGYSPQTSTLYLSDEAETGISRFSEDWTLGWGLGRENLVIESATQRRLVERTKNIMDPDGKLNRGEIL